jgi:uncharacterized membrane protein
MKPKRSKYDTNPLDDKVADRAEQSWGPPTEQVGGETRDIGRGPQQASAGNAESEAPTRRIDNEFVTSYPSVFVPPTHRQPDVYQPPRVTPEDIYQPPPMAPPSVYQRPPSPVRSQRPGSRNVAGLGIPEKWANLLPYAPFHIGAVAAVMELLLVPRSESRARFHAAQGLALQLAILVFSGVFQFVNLISGSSIGSRLFGTAATVFLIISMVRVWRGKPHHIAPLDQATKWFEEKINPRK